MKYKDKIDVLNLICECNETNIEEFKGFEKALVGYDATDGIIPTPIYDRNKMIDILMKRDGMTYEQADEYIDYNVTGSIPPNDNRFPRVVIFFHNKKNK